MCASSHLTTQTNSATKYFRPEGTMFNESYYLHLCNKTIYLSPIARVSDTCPKRLNEPCKLGAMHSPLCRIHKEIFNDRVTVNGHIFITCPKVSERSICFPSMFENLAQQCGRLGFQDSLRIPSLPRSRYLAMRHGRPLQASLDSASWPSSL